MQTLYGDTKMSHVVFAHNSVICQLRQVIKKWKCDNITTTICDDLHRLHIRGSYLKIKTMVPLLDHPVYISSVRFAR